MKVFDWHKAAKLIREKKPKLASAGLSGDWGCTGGTIYAEGKPVPSEETFTFLASTWATPKLDLDGTLYECYVLDTPETNPDEWTSKTYWPESAVRILQGSPSSGAREFNEYATPNGDSDGLFTCYKCKHS
jgi:hypothetical protein